MRTGYRKRGIQTKTYDSMNQKIANRNTFNLTHSIGTSFNHGYLIPFFIMKVLPTDYIEMMLDAFLRMQPTIFPFMGDIKCCIDVYYVSQRILWQNWDYYNGDQTDAGIPDDTLTMPQIAIPTGGFGELSVADYFGLPTLVESTETINALPFRAYNKIWDRDYRNENVIDAPYLTTGDTDEDTLETITNYPLQKVKKMSDRFVSSNPYQQKGPAVTFNLGGEAPILQKNLPTGIPKEFIGLNSTIISTDGGSTFEAKAQTQPTGAEVVAGTGYQNIQFNSITNSAIVPSGSQVGFLGLYNTYADLSGATAENVNTMRQKVAQQERLERMAKVGTKRSELKLGKYGLKSLDARLQIPEYIGGGCFDLNITPVAQTSNTGADTTAQGNLAGIPFMNNNNKIMAHKFVEEEGYIIGMIYCRGIQSYQQGLEKNIWSEKTIYDQHEPLFNNLGEQPIYNKEIWLGSEDENGIFGYQEVYSEYKYITNKVTGRFRANATGTLASWNICNYFDTLPTLSKEFVEEEIPIDRITAVPDTDHYFGEIRLKIAATRPLPIEADPTIDANLRLWN